jgi:hypothetical protein
MASTTLAKTITDKASVFLADASQTRWLPSELLSWLNDGQSEICSLVPNANPSTSTVVLLPGVKQTAPTDALYINGFIRNMGVGGTTPGGIIRQVTRNFLNSFIVGWSNATTSTTVTHIAYDPADSNLDYYVYPPQPATGMSSIEIVYSKVPSTIAAIDATTVITIRDIYANALLDYVLYRAFGKDSEYGNQSDRSQIHYKMFSNAIGMKYTIEKSENTGYLHTGEKNQQANPPQ